MKLTLTGAFRPRSFESPGRLPGTPEVRLSVGVRQLVALVAADAADRRPVVVLTRAAE